MQILYYDLPQESGKSKLLKPDPVTGQRHSHTPHILAQLQGRESHSPRDQGFTLNLMNLSNHGESPPSYLSSRGLLEFLLGKLRLVL